MTNKLISAPRVYGLEEAIIASGFPKRPEAPSEEEYEDKVDELMFEIHGAERESIPHIKRAYQLGGAPRGSGHDNFLKGITVSFNLNFTVKAWTEAERYHWFDIVSSMSSMHCLTRMDFDECFCERVTENTKNEMKRLLQIWDENPTADNELNLLYNCPTGLRLMARISTNYLQLKTIYAQRKSHRLPEWQDFCKWVETLPLADKLICV